MRTKNTLLGLTLMLAWAGWLGATSIQGEADQDGASASSGSSGNLVKNPNFKIAGAQPWLPADYTLQGDVRWANAGKGMEASYSGIALHSSKDLDGDGKHEGSVAQLVTIGSSRWYRFTLRGMPEPNFAVEQDDLFMKVEFYSRQGGYLDGVTRKIFSLVERDRKELGVNGNYKKNGAAVWKTYVLEFKLPFPEVDQVKVSAGFRNGAATEESDSAFYVAEFSLAPIPDPAGKPKIVKVKNEAKPDLASLVPLGGRWFYQPEPGWKPGSSVTVTVENAHRLFYVDSRLTNPFAENMTAWLRAGNLDANGRVVTEDRLVPNNVVVRFEGGKTMIVRAHNLPNHPTAQFPGANPHYIQELENTYYFPLQPARNPRALPMDKTNSNRALNMGAIGIAINGVVFYNPFDAGMTDATSIMDRCCGHPSPDNRYHYHKYPVCVKSPFVDEGEEHSPLIGWAFDGFPIYGPYERKGLMAKDCTDNPLNEFNLHHDEEHGWHYHVTPGKFPYVIGGYWGEVDSRNLRRGPRGGRGE